MKKKVVIAGVVVAAIAVVAGISAMRKKPVEEETLIPVVNVENPQMGSIELYRSLVGKVEPSDVVSSSTGFLRIALMPAATAITATTTPAITTFFFIAVSSYFPLFMIVILSYLLRNQGSMLNHFQGIQITFPDLIQLIRLLIVKAHR